MNHTKTDRIWPARLFAFPILQLKFSTQRWAVPTEVCPNCNSMSKANALFEATEFRSNLLCSYCCCSVAQLCLTLCHPMDCSTPGFLSFTISRSLLRLMSIESVMPSNHLILCCPLLLLPSIFPRIRVFSNESALCIRWPILEFQLQHQSFQCIFRTELISFRTDWLDLLVVQGTLKSLLQHHSPKASILQCSAFFIVQFSHPYMTTGKIIALTRQTFVGRVMSLFLTCYLGWS